MSHAKVVSHDFRDIRKLLNNEFSEDSVKTAKSSKQTLNSNKSLFKYLGNHPWHTVLAGLVSGMAVHKILLG
jgi:hypothetical protein